MNHDVLISEWVAWVSTLIGVVAGALLAGMFAYEAGRRNGFADGFNTSEQLRREREQGPIEQPR